ncbi:hypothetical protein ACEWY4_018660 [Coilia grayii]|uniref:G-protein coupled receptors family 1 profile domain-containing protein n=1 Tax=Coilia grayii TaxID=363190 RepID=A0ABD1JDU9_9TELE
MKNASSFQTFILINYEPMEQQKYVYIIIFSLPYILIVVFNTCLIYIICKDRTLHGPMYIFICNLSFNGIYGGTALLPHTISKLATQSYEMSRANCFIQIFCLHTFTIVEFTILAVMGYDRYAAICTPLHYHNKMSPRNVKILIAFSWLFPLCAFPMWMSWTTQLSFCGNIIHKTHCTNFDLIKLSCNDTFVQNIVGMLLLGVFMIPQLIVISFSYVQILRICLYGSKDSKKKALQTCMPHLLTVINYVCGGCFELIQVRLKTTHTQYGMSLFMSVYFLIIPPLLNPVVYGSTVLKKHIYTFVQRKKLSPVS